MRMFRRPLFIGLLSVLPLGCAIFPAADKQPVANSSESTAQPMALIAKDFIQALRQIRSLSPVSTTVHLLSYQRDDRFVQSLQTALLRAGYGVRWVDNAVGKLLLQYRRERELGDQGGNRDRFEMAVGSVELRRTYLIKDDTHVSPLTPLYVRGADASRIVLNDDLFNQDVSISNASYNDMQRVPSRKQLDGEWNPSAGIAATGVSILTVPDDANPLDSRVFGRKNVKPLTLPLLALPTVQNVFELGVSNYKDALADHQIVAEQILTFPNDSLRLGLVNKRFINHLVERFNPQTDLFSVIGCSLGPTTLKSGNAALALGRASRVREALLFAGVPQQMILDEGCWAGDSAGLSLPRRGVVVTLNRQS